MNSLTHHKWWDGTGYPAELAGADVPISGRIVAIADVFDALTHDRAVARPAWSITDSLHDGWGRQFDPALLDAFAQLDPELLPGTSRDVGVSLVGAPPRLTQAVNQ